MKKTLTTLVALALAIGMLVLMAIPVAAAGSGSLVTGGGTIRYGGKVVISMSGWVGFTDSGEIVGNFQLIDYQSKNIYKCQTPDFTYLTFYGDEAASPTAAYNTAEFIGTFYDKYDTPVTVTIVITDNAETGGGADTVDANGNWDGVKLSTGNFQVH